MAQLKSLTINDTGFLQLPSGTSAQRPAAPISGMMRYNTDFSCNEFFDGVNWIDPVTGNVLTDPYFNRVTLLMHGDGTNGAHNNTFVDGSPNNFTITRNGNTTQGTFGPFGDLWSNYFDGNADNLTIGSTSAFRIATSTTPFTIECWVYPIADGGCIFSEQFTTSGNPVDIAITMSSTAISSPNGRTIAFGYYTGSAWVTAAIANSQLILNTWTHVACVFTGSTTRIFYNGFDVTATSPTPATTWGRTGSSGNNWYIGQRWDTVSPAYFNGYISNFRFVNGTALYTSNFTPPTSPLTAITNTVLLTCQSNRFVDNSTNNLSITRTGDVSVQRFSPFFPSSAYDQSILGASGFFDGSGDYLGLTGTNLSTGNWTIEGWVYFTSATNTAQHIFNFGTDANNRYGLYRRSTGVIDFFTANSGTFVSILSTVVPSVGSWNHFAVVRNSGTHTLYINGVSQASGTTNINPGTNWSLGFQQFAGVANDYFTGYISNFRVVTSALYTSNFTPPASPLTAVTNTSLLLNFNNAAIRDNTGINNLETVANAQISTTQSKFGGSSLYFDGTGDVVEVTYTSLGHMNLLKPWGSDSYTLECWLYFNSVAAGQFIFTGYTQAIATEDFAVYTNAAGTLNYFLSSDGANWNLANAVSVGSISTGQWYHFAFVKNRNTWTPYLNGVAGTSTTTATAIFRNTLPLSVGGIIGGAAGSGLNGYIDELRITRGVARYTSNFVPPSGPFPDKF